MVKISFNGACKEVGRSAILIESEKTNDSILLDYGVKMSGKEDNFPNHISGKKLKAIVVTHSHIDHVGGVPIFYISGNVPLYMTKLTFEVSQVLLRDMMNISEFFLPFDREAISRLRKNIQFLDFKNRTKVGEDSYLTLLDAGHIPGSAMVLLEMDGKKILYTGDMNSVATQLMHSAVPPKDKIDVLILEGTYGTTDHEQRSKVEKNFIENTNRVLNNGGKVLVPAFGVARSQEILMVLSEYNLKYPIFVDGMARRIGKIYATHDKEFFKSWKKMNNALNKSHYIIQKERNYERKKAKDTKGVVVAPSGMLKGGTARMYAENILKDPNSAIFLVSYQIPNSPGAVLLEEHKYALDTKNPDEKEDILCEVLRFKFSSHSGKSDLIKFANGCKFTSKKKILFIVHSDKDVAEEFSKTLNNKGFIASAPSQSDFYIIE
ncbi:MAG: MBL fold metallo-hydrolase [archaeon]|nr:MBL fold metallo-hydrolase [archaeon]